MPKFSIIIPVYNVAPYLRECLDSVLAQTFTDWEAICVDDGSMDGSGVILDEYAAKDSRIRVIHQANSGVSAARNVALDAANGEWILFLDSDDVWHTRLLEKVSLMITSFPAEKLFRIGFVMFNDAYREVDLNDNKYAEAVYKIIDISKEILMRDFFFFFFSCYAYRKDLFVGVRFPHYKRGEDRCVLNRIQLELVDSIIAIETPLYSYRLRQGSAMRSVPSTQVILDEMDHRLDIMEMIDRSGKVVAYAGDWWLEEYFTKSLPMMFIVQSNTCKLKREWRNRLSRLRKCRGVSKTGKFLMWLYSSRVLSPIGDFIVLGRVGLRHCISKISYIVRFCSGKVR